MDRGTCAPAGLVPYQDICKVLTAGTTRHPMGRTPAQEGTNPVNLNQGDWLGASRTGKIAKTSVEDFRWYHQYETGSLEVASFARMSLAIVRHCHSHAPFCHGKWGEMVVSLAP
eukprot:5379731-Pleurochrysis_carterae.AAC.1